jgi:hypothetical protein
MLNSIIVASPPLRVPDLSSLPVAQTEVADLIRQQNDLITEQNQLIRTLIAQNDASPRWRNFLAKWREEFPDIGLDCKRVLPSIERTYLNMIREVNDRLTSVNPEELASDFALGEFLDRFSMRLSQLSGIINQLNPLADNVPPPAPTTDE